MMLDKNITFRSLLITVIAIFLASGLYGCASDGIKYDNGEAVRDESSVLSIFNKGGIRLTCGISCSGSWGSSRVDLKFLYSQSRWNDIVFVVARIGYGDDLAYFYLGRAAEELGSFDAALTYYQLALKNHTKCDGLFNICDGFLFPSDINSRIYYVQERLAAATQAKSNIPRKKSDRLSNSAYSSGATTIEATSNKQDEALKLAISNFSLNEIKQYIGIMLDGVKDHNDSDINSGLAALNQMAHPKRGDRKVARNYNAKGLSGMRSGSFSEAVSIFADAVRTDPADPEIIDNLSIALQKISRFEDARHAALCALSLAPTRATAWANLGTVLAQENKEESAVASFMLTFRFSKNQQKTRDYFKSLVDGDAPTPVKQAAAKALNQFGSQ